MVRAFLLSVLLTSPSQNPEELLTEGKLRADLGDYEAAAAAFESVANDTNAPDTSRWEAFVRLGQASAAAQQHVRSLAAYRRVLKDYGRDPEAVRFLLFAVSGTVPMDERWEEIWPRVRLTSDPGTGAAVVR